MLTSLVPLSSEVPDGSDISPFSSEDTDTIDFGGIADGDETELHFNDKAVAPDKPG